MIIVLDMECLACLINDLYIINSKIIMQISMLSGFFYFIFLRYRLIIEVIIEVKHFIPKLLVFIFAALLLRVY